METNKELMELQRYGFDGSFGGDFGLLSDGPYVKLADVTAALSQRSEAVDERLPVVSGGSVEIAHIMAIAKATGIFGRIGITEIKDFAIGLLNEFAIQPAPAPSAAAGEQVPYGYVARANDGHETYFKERPTGFEDPTWKGLMTVVPLYDKKTTPAWDADATTRLRSIVDLLGLQSAVPEGDLTGYEFAVLGHARREIERLKAAAQPTPAQGDAVPVADAKLAVGVRANSNGITIAVHLKQGDVTTVLYTQDHPLDTDSMGAIDVPAALFATRQSSADAGDAECWRFMMRAVDDPEGQEAAMLEKLADQLDTDEEAESVMMARIVRAAIAAQGGKGGSHAV